MNQIDDAPIHPGMPEIRIGLITLAIVGIGGSIAIAQVLTDPVLIGLILTAMSGIGGLAGFAAAYRWRIRSLAPFGIRSTTTRWLLLAVGAGILAFIAKSLAILIIISIVGQGDSPQEVYATGASGGWWTIILATVFLTVLTPIGEEFLFRGVVQTALFRRYGPIVAVGAAAFCFAIFHGINIVFPVALITGVIAGEIFRRSGSIWPAVVVHGVVNLPTIPMMVLANAAQ